jgi:NADP-dependent 3-hydroxy acid dehydrogenase YdfG
MQVFASTVDGVMLNSVAEAMHLLVFICLIIKYVIPIAVDVSGNYEVIEKALHDAEEEIGPISVLVNCAGMAICGRLEDTSVEDIKVSCDFVSSWKTSYEILIIGSCILLCV